MHGVRFIFGVCRHPGILPRVTRAVQRTKSAIGCSPNLCGSAFASKILCVIYDVVVIISSFSLNFHVAFSGADARIMGTDPLLVLPNVNVSCRPRGPAFFVCLYHCGLFPITGTFFRAQRAQTTQCVEAGWATEGAPGGATLTT